MIIGDRYPTAIQSMACIHNDLDVLDLTLGILFEVKGPRPVIIVQLSFKRILTHIKGFFNSMKQALY